MTRSSSGSSRRTTAATGRSTTSTSTPGARGSCWARGRRHGPALKVLRVKIAVAADERVGVAEAVVSALRDRGHEPVLHGALADGDRPDWAWCCEAAARDVAAGRAEQAIVCCWTGTGASIAANKVPGIRAALCADAVTADGARRWNDANVLALSLRATSEAELAEILDAWFRAPRSDDADARANVAPLREMESAG